MRPGGKEAAFRTQQVCLVLRTTDDLLDAVVGIAVANESLRESPYRLPNQAEEMDKDCGWRFGISHTDHAGERAGSCVA